MVGLNALASYGHTPGVAPGARFDFDVRPPGFVWLKLEARLDLPQTVEDEQSGAAAEVRRHASWSEFLNAEARLQGRLLLFTTGGDTPFQRFAYRAGDTLLFGRESAGAPAEVHAAADARLLIPIKAETRSLNLVTAAALALGCALTRVEGFPSAPGWS